MATCVEVGGSAGRGKGAAGRAGLAKGQPQVDRLA